MTKCTIDAKRVNEIFRSCLFREDEDHSMYTPALGVWSEVGFHPGRIVEHKEEITAILDELPVEFREQNGGESFLRAKYDNAGNQWTDSPQQMEQLILLGWAIGKVGYVAPYEEDAPCYKIISRPGVVTIKEF